MKDAWKPKPRKKFFPQLLPVEGSPASQKTSARKEDFNNQQEKK
jgi:hypothetical protein